MQFKELYIYCFQFVNNKNHKPLKKCYFKSYSYTDFRLCVIGTGCSLLVLKPKSPRVKDNILGSYNLDQFKCLNWCITKGISNDKICSFHNFNFFSCTYCGRKRWSPNFLWLSYSSGFNRDVWDRCGDDQWIKLDYARCVKAEV